MSPVDDLEALADKLARLTDAEFLAIDAMPDMVREIRAIHYETLDQIRSAAGRILRARPAMAGIGPQAPMEALERAFAALRFAAEIEWRRSMKLRGKEAKKSRVQAERLADLTHQSALALKIAAEAKGVWSADYAEEHGLEPWL